MNPAIEQMLAQLTERVTKIKGASDSADALIRGIPALLQKAREEAMALGATVEELAPVQALSDLIETEANELIAAVNAAPTS